MGLKLNGEVSLDGSGFSRGLAGLNNSLGSFKTALATAFGGIAIGNLVKGTIEWASQLQDSADALGVNVEFLQKLENGAKLAGAELGDVSRFILEMNKSRQDALQEPKGKNAAAFGRLGISSSQVSQLSTQAFFEQILAAFKNGATVQLTNDVVEVGGKSAKNLIAAFANQFASDTPILAAAMIEQLDDIGDSFTILKTTLMVSLAPAIIWVVEKVRDFINTIKQLGAFLGGMFWHTMDSGFSGEGDNAFTAGGLAAEAEAQRQKAERQTFGAGRDAARAARKARENAGMPFEQIHLAPKATGASAKQATDALLSVGNFLGSGSGLINSIASQQLHEQKTTNQKLDKANDTLKTIATMFPKDGFFAGIEVP